MADIDFASLEVRYLADPKAHPLPTPVYSAGPRPLAALLQRPKS
jgi:hypothetical protein